MKVSNFPTFARLWPEKTVEDELHLLQKILFLAAHDVVFFGTWDEERSKREGKNYWGENARPALMMNDTFYYASADAEGFGEADVDLLVDLYQRFDYHGPTAWAAVKRGEEPLPQRQSEQYHAARAWLEDQRNSGAPDGM